MMERLAENIQYIKGVGPTRSRQLNRLGITNIFDILWHVPRGYINRDHTACINTLQPGETVSIRATILGTTSSRARRGMSILKALLQDRTGITTAVWFNQPFLKNTLKTGQEIFLTGKVAEKGGQAEINVAEYEMIGNEEETAKIAAVYPLTEGLNQKSMRRIVATVIDGYLREYPDILPGPLRDELSLCDIRSALRNIHCPQNRENYFSARQRLAFEELLLFQLNLVKNSLRTNEKGIPHAERDDLVSKVKGNLPYHLTGAQQKVIREIFADMESETSMTRLLQGDVGAGKTVVAALAAAKCVSSGHQAAIMAPTEILSRQHFCSMQKFFAGTNVAIASLTSGTHIKARNQILSALACGEVNIIVGTHSLIQDDIKFASLGLTVIDEQHRFGVRQRARLNQKGQSPDMLVMTATPIPRTLALTLYGDLEISIINELPPGRKPIPTKFIPHTGRKKVYDFVEKQVEQGAQVYIVCPLVEESQKQDLQAAVSLYDELSQIVFPQFSVGLLHGKMKAEEKQAEIEKFKRRKIDILITTTIIEVGIDVPNASLMIIEHAERFGLAQLHQLRGRVGRGQRQSYCILTGNPQSEEAFRRIKAMEKTNDGFLLAQEDLKIRGPGEFMGVRQHGLQQFKIADLTADLKLSEKAREIARTIEVPDNKILNKYLQLKFKNDLMQISG
ncbi:MAG: ATP-dependent DNA helicase RecG [Syntrophomonadaceae bacterium]|nr:ATP-dependent DNA helicase RecG [Syntrophomonadaceae bacterium]